MDDARPETGRAAADDARTTPNGGGRLAAEPAAGGDRPADDSPASDSPASDSPAAADQPASQGPPPAGPAEPGVPGASTPRPGTPRPGTPPPAAPRPAAPKAAAPKEPSWPHVIATTLRLWLQRRVAGRPGARRRAVVFGAVIIVFAAGGLTFALAQRQPAPAPRPARSSAPAQLSPGAVAANRQAAATWVAAQVSHSVVVSCDPVMCAALQADGFPAGDLLSLSASANDPLGSAVVVSTTALRNQFGSRLPDVYAPVVLAAFGTGPARVDVRVEAPDGGQAYLVTQRADQLARQASGQQLLANKNLHVSAAAGEEIAAGNLDTRLLITLATLAAQVHRVNVIAVGDSGPGASAGVPLRMVELSMLVEPGHPGQNAAYLKAVLAFLKAQRSPFLASVSVLRQGGDNVVQVEFAAPSPLGLLGTTAP
jgi:hypothetical protein